MFFSDKYKINKTSVALAIVSIDLIIAFFFYVSLIYLRGVQKKTAAEINEQILKPSDFSVQIKNLPKEADLKILKIKLWNFIDTVLEKENYNLKNQKVEFDEKGELKEQEDDEYQNNVMDINFGLQDYERMNCMLKMAKLIKRKKK